MTDCPDVRTMAAVARPAASRMVTVLKTRMVTVLKTRMVTVLKTRMVAVSEGMAR
jgi:hypothetical protein